VGSGPLSLPPRNSCEAQGNPARPPGIEGVEMRKVIITSCQGLLQNSLAAIGLLGSFGARSSPRCEPLRWNRHEGLTISAPPWTDAASTKRSFRKSRHTPREFLPCKSRFANDSDDSMKVNLSRIRLTVHVDAENTQELPSLSSEDWCRPVLKPGGKDPSATRKKLPVPVPLPKGNKDKNAVNYSGKPRMPVSNRSHRPAQCSARAAVLRPAKASLICWIRLTSTCPNWC